MELGKLTVLPKPQASFKGAASGGRGKEEMSREGGGRPVKEVGTEHGRRRRLAKAGPGCYR